MRTTVTRPRPDVLSIMGSIVEELKRPAVIAVYLFGSHARGTAGPTSDLDICVITERDISRQAKEEIMGNSSRNIDVVLFWDLPPVIRFRVLREGRPLYVRDELELHRIKVKTLDIYLDMQSMLKRHCDRLLQGRRNV
ncbi:MAG: nucleotidyltransferase domain-containing protein [Dehalococcoidia bacterium]